MFTLFNDLTHFSPPLRIHLEKRVSAALPHNTFFRPDEADPSRVILATWKSGTGAVQHSFKTNLMCDPALLAELDHEIDVFLALGDPMDRRENSVNRH